MLFELGLICISIWLLIFLVPINKLLDHNKNVICGGVKKILII